MSSLPILRRAASNALPLKYDRFKGRPRQDRPIALRRNQGNGGQTNSKAGQGSTSTAQ
jgi:hypothetical protein